MYVVDFYDENHSWLRLIIYLFDDYVKLNIGIDCDGSQAIYIYYCVDIEDCSDSVADASTPSPYCPKVVYTVSLLDRCTDR